MDEDISIINTNTRNERIKNFLIKNKNKFILISLAIVVILICAYSFDKYKTNQKKEISNKFNLTTLAYSKDSINSTIDKLLEIINEKDPTYSPLSLYFIIDNQLISDQSEINSLFNILINKTSLDEEIKNLIIYKKALFNADQAAENELLDILKPLINSKSVWKSHALYLLAEYFFSKNQKKKAIEFFNQIIILETANPEIIQLARKRVNRDLSE